MGSGEGLKRFTPTKSRQFEALIEPSRAINLRWTNAGQKRRAAGAATGPW
jgi:hypothetical protein